MCLTTGRGKKSKQKYSNHIALVENAYSKEVWLINDVLVTFALLRNSSDLHFYKDLYGEINKTVNNEKITLEF